MSANLANPIPIPIQKKVKKDAHLILFGTTFSKENMLALESFLLLVNIVIVYEHVVKFQNLKNIFQIIAKMHQRQSLENI